MSSPAVVLPPLARLEPGEREVALRVLIEGLSTADAVKVVAALAASDAAVLALPEELVHRAAGLLVSDLPAPSGALLTIFLGLTRGSTDDWLPQLRARIDSLSVEEAIAWASGKRDLPELR